MLFLSGECLLMFLNLEHGDTSFLRNFRKYLPDCTASRRKYHLELGRTSEFGVSYCCVTSLSTWPTSQLLIPRLYDPVATLPFCVTDSRSLLLIASRPVTFFFLTNAGFPLCVQYDTFPLRLICDRMIRAGMNIFISDYNHQNVRFNHPDMLTALYCTCVSSQNGVSCNAWSHFTIQ
jgi:hypothetical protein